MRMTGVWGRIAGLAVSMMLTGGVQAERVPELPVAAFAHKPYMADLSLVPPAMAPPSRRPAAGNGVA